MVVPQIIQFNRDFHYKSSIRGTPIFGNTQMSRTTNEHVQNARKTRRTGTEFWNCFGGFFRCFDFSNDVFLRKTGVKIFVQKEALELDILVSNFLSRTEFDAIRDGHHYSDDLANPGTNGCRKLQVELWWNVAEPWSCFLRLNWNPSHLTSDEWIRRSLSHQEKTTFSIIPSKKWLAKMMDTLL